MNRQAERAIGGWGTAARLVVGGGLVGSVAYGHAARGWHLEAWVLGLLVLPGLVFAGHRWWVRRRPAPVRTTMPL